MGSGPDKSTRRATACIVSPVAMPGRRGQTVGTTHRDINCRVLKFTQIRWSRRESSTFTTIDLELPGFTRPPNKGGIIGRSVQPMFECGPKSAYWRPRRLTTVRIAATNTYRAQERERVRQIESRAPSKMLRATQYKHGI